MRIYAQIVARVLLSATFFKLAGIQLLMSMKIKLFQNIVELVIARVLKTVPAPVAHCSKWNAVAEFLRKSLQSGGINGEGESSVANRKR